MSFISSLSWLGLNECFFSTQATSSIGENNLSSFSLSSGDNSFFTIIVGHHLTAFHASCNNLCHLSVRIFATSQGSEDISACGFFLNAALSTAICSLTILSAIHGISA